MKKKQKILTRKHLYIGIGLIVALLIFLYLKIVYFPSRANINDIPLPFLMGEGEAGRARKIDIETLRSFSGDYIVSTNTVAALEDFYNKTHDEEVAMSLIHMYLGHNKFDEAFTLIKDIYHNDIDFTLIPANTFLYILFNSSQLSPSNYNTIEGILDDYKENVLIDSETYTLYRGLLDVYRDNTEGFYSAVESLSGSKQNESLYKGIQNAKKTSKDVQTTLPYYTDGLSAMVLLQQGYYRVAQKRSVSIRQKDQKYVLPYQILAQAAMLQSHRQEAVQYFDTLLKLDTSHADQYHFGLCVSYFWQSQFKQTLLHCQQVKDANNTTDALRYMLLSYYQTKNRAGMMNTFQVVLAKQKITENDYYTFFDIVFYQPFVTNKDFSHVQKYYISVILPFLDRCVTTLGAGHDVCKYGQAGFYLYKNDLAKARKDLLYLASRHPTSYVFRALGEYYETTGEEEKAKAYYLRAMTVATGALIDISSENDPKASGTGNALGNY